MNFISNYATMKTAINKKRNAMKHFKSIQPLLSYTRRAVDTYNMINQGEKIAVGVSGGKDSMALLCALKALSVFHPSNFSVVAITLDMGFPDADLSPIVKLCEDLEVELHIVKTDIYDIVFNYRNEKCPCSLCAKLRRGAIHDAAISIGCRKVALGHHFDDAIETFMMNLFNEGRIGCFSPVTYLDRKDITLIRPFIYLPEKMVTSFINKENIEITKKVCPEDGNTDREKIKQLLSSLEKEDKGLKQRIFGAMERGEIDGFKVSEYSRGNKKLD